MLKRTLTPFALLLITGFLGCGSSAATGAGGAATEASVATSASTSGTSVSGGTTTAVTSSQASTGAGGASGAPTAAQLLALTTQCNQLSNGFYKSDSGASPADIPVCGLVGAVFWKADMDVDCDGKSSPQCNLQTDPAYQNQTAANDSNGNPLDAAALPYVVIPGASGIFKYSTQGLHMGSVVAVIYNDKVVYGVIGDSGPTTIIGEASYAMAAALGINPDPSVGGVDSGVTYIAFTGASAVSSPIEDAAHTTSLGETLAKAIIASGGK